MAEAMRREGEGERAGAGLGAGASRGGADRERGRGPGGGRGEAAPVSAAERAEKSMRERGMPGRLTPEQREQLDQAAGPLEEMEAGSIRLGKDLWAGWAVGLREGKARAAVCLFEEGARRMFEPMAKEWGFGEAAGPLSDLTAFIGRMWMEGGELEQACRRMRGAADAREQARAIGEAAEAARPGGRRGL